MRSSVTTSRTRQRHGGAHRGWARAAMALPMAALLLSGCGTSAKNDTFDLSAASVPAARQSSARGRQLLIPPPSALKALDSDHVLVRLSDSEIQYLGKSQWSDNLPLMVQSKLVQAFEDTGKLGGVGIPGQGLAIDYQLLTDIRSFEVDTQGGNRAVIEISAKLLNDRNGTIVRQQVFSATMPARGGDNAAFVAALDQAFGTVTTQIVNWTLKVL